MKQIKGNPSPVFMVDPISGESTPIGYTDDGYLVMDIVHRHVHQGVMWHTEYTASTVNGANLDFGISTGALPVHSGLAVWVAGACTMTFYEAPSTFSGGGALTPVNLNRLSPAAPLSTFVSAPTLVLTGGTALVNGRLIPGGASAQTRVGGDARSGAEFILKPSTKYALRINNTSGSTILISAVIEFYEEVP